jgi:hypothetical protein
VKVRRGRQRREDSAGGSEDGETVPTLLNSLRDASLPQDKIADLLFDELEASRGRCTPDHLRSILSDILAILPPRSYPYRRAR